MLKIQTLQATWNQNPKCRKVWWFCPTFGCVFLLAPGRRPCRYCDEDYNASTKEQVFRFQLNPCPELADLAAHITKLFLAWGKYWEYWRGEGVKEDCCSKWWQQQVFCWQVGCHTWYNTCGTNLSTGILQSHCVDLHWCSIDSWVWSVAVYRWHQADYRSPVGSHWAPS